MFNGHFLQIFLPNFVVAFLKKYPCAGCISLLRTSARQSVGFQKCLNGFILIKLYAVFFDCLPKAKLDLFCLLAEAVKVSHWTLSPLRGLL